MLDQRIIACLDVNNGKVVKGTQFRQHEIMGDILPLAEKYAAEGADELVLYDISASVEQRVVDKSWIKDIAERINIPLAVAGGISSVEQAQEVLAFGAAKVSINSPALQRPDLINELVAAFGSEKVVVGIDSFYHAETDSYQVLQFTGDESRTETTAWNTFDWVQEVVKRGAGEIVLNCMNQDGVRQGYDIQQLQAVRAICPVSLVASGGAGSNQHVHEVFAKAQVNGALLASALHKSLVSLRALQAELSAQPARSNILNVDTLAWQKMDQLIPCVVQHVDTGQVLMQGYMNREAVEATQASGHVTFFSRSKNRLWCKGETSGNTLELVELTADCDRDALLALARPKGPTCHLGTDSCWQPDAALATAPYTQLAALERTIAERQQAAQPNTSYTAQLLAEGVQRCAQKVGEEGVEVALAGVVENDQALLNESADLLYHLLVLLKARGLSMADVSKVLAQRAQA